MPDFSHLDWDAGKYAIFVWPAFAVTAAVFAGMIWSCISHARRWKRRYEELSDDNR